MELSFKASEMKAAIYPGVFDPPTLGHLNIIERASSRFDRLVIAVGNNLIKEAPFFSLDERINFLKEITAKIENVEVFSFNGLLVDFAKQQKIEIIVRAIRTIFDFEIETLQSQLNRHFDPQLETFYLVVNEKYRLISSTIVRELASFGKRLIDFVPAEIEEVVLKKFINKSF